MVKVVFSLAVSVGVGTGGDVTTEDGSALVNKGVLMVLVTSKVLATSE